jgi:hypothetical protein
MQRRAILLLLAVSAVLPAAPARRLNRYEYYCTIRDLLGVDFRANDNVPISCSVRHSAKLPGRLACRASAKSRCASKATLNATILFARLLRSPPASPLSWADICG